MINLVSPDHRKNIQIAKSNSVLLGYIQILFLAALVIASVVVGAYYFLDLQHTDAVEIANIEKKDVAELEPYQKKAENLAGSMTAIAGVFDSEISFSLLLQELGRNMPTGAALHGLELSTDTVDSPVTVTAYIGTEAQGVMLLENFRNSSVVKSVTLRTVQRLDQPFAEKYFYSSTYELTLNKEAI
ncbi:MAG: hypothetical protein ACSLEY_01950 [Candidatus Saccharimonadales bacterium]